MNVYEIITDRIVKLLEQGTVPWRKPWRGGPAGQPRNLRSGRPYRGVNVFLLATSGYVSPTWVTYKQAVELGGSVRKGEHGMPVVFWNWLDKKTAGAEAEPEAHGDRVPLIRYYTVFNVAQCDGLKDPSEPVTEQPFEPIAACERVVAEMRHPPGIEHREIRAYYRPNVDIVNVPRPELFEHREGYYATLFHELSHATGHERRLGRRGVTDAQMFGSHEYSKEELIAEMSSAFLCGQCGIETATIENSVAYLKGWLDVLRGDTRMVVQAAANAQRAADLILNRVFEEEARHSV